VQRSEIESALKVDPVWSAYALADLDPAYQEYCRWNMSGSALILEYAGLEPPVLFAFGPVNDFKPLANQIRPGRYQYTLLERHYPAIQARLAVEIEARMWRMVLDPQKFSGGMPNEVNQLTQVHTDALQALFKDHPDRPDAYHPSQLIGPGVFYGVFVDDQLVAAAGTHIVSPEMSVAAIGNIFTHPDWRGRGLCARVTQAVAAHLVTEGIELIVLNVKVSNAGALRCYEKVGFTPHCQYLEGIGRIS
jgi:ribosomal protein S18 acetylase RimI-like enzyme